MDTVGMQTFSDGSSQLHVSGGTLAFEIESDLHVQRGDKFGVAQLPHVHVMTADDPRQFLDVVFDVFDADPRRHALEEDARGGFAEWNGGCENDQGDEQRDQWVRVVSPPVRCQPDDQR